MRAAPAAGWLLAPHRPDRLRRIESLLDARLMRNRRFLVLRRAAALVLFLALAQAPAWAHDLQAELPPLFRQRIADIENRLAAPDGILSARDASNAALAQLALGGDPGVAEALLRQVFAAQDPETGALPWLLRGGEVKDDNANEFGVQSWGPILIGYRDRLSPAAQRELEAHARLALRALARSVDVNYTNIYLMNAVDTLLIGQALGDAQALARGRALLDAWRSAVHDHGVAEFASPTYYSTDLNSLTVAYRYARDERDRTTIRNILDFFWVDLSLSLVNGKLVGAHSRDYDPIHGAGYISLFLGNLGCGKCALPVDQIIEKIYPYLNALPGGYRAPPGIEALNRVNPRWILARWGADPAAVRSLYVDGGAAMGATAQGNLSSTSKVFAIDLLRDDGPQVTISFIASERDLGYGQTVPMGRGRRHSGAIGLNPVIAQSKDWALGSFSVSKSGDPDAQPISLSLILPRYANEIRVNGAPLAADRRLNDDVRTIFVRVGRSCAAIRILAADASQPAEVRDDAPQQAQEAMRVLWRTDRDHMQLSFLAHAASCGGLGAAEWIAQLETAPLANRSDGAQMSLAAQAPGNAPMRIVRNAAPRGRAMLIDAPGRGAGGVLSANGVDYADVLYRGWPRGFERAQ